MDRCMFPFFGVSAFGGGLCRMLCASTIREESLIAGSDDEVVGIAIVAVAADAVRDGVVVDIFGEGAIVFLERVGVGILLWKPACLVLGEGEC